MSEQMSGAGIDYVLIRDADDWLIGFVPTFTSCFAVGRTVEELEENLIDAVLLHSEVLEASNPRAEFLGVRTISL